MGYSDERVMLAVCGRLKISIEEYKQHLQREELRCNICKQWKNSVEFVSCKRRPRGITSICNRCNVKHVQEYAENNREMVSKKIHDRYFADVENSRRRTRERNERYRKNSPEKRAASVRKYLDKPGVQQKHKQGLSEWRAENPDKYAMQRLLRRVAYESIDFDENQLMELRLHYAPDGKCMCCHEEKRLQVDHIFPVARGGKTTLDNLQFLCQGCNFKKHTKIIDFRPDGGEFVRFLKEQK